VIKHVFWVGLAYQLGKNKNSSLREKDGSTDSTRCFQGSGSEVSQDSTGPLAELPRSRKQMLKRVGTSTKLFLFSGRP
jgi:hypothetical protein